MNPNFWNVWTIKHLYTGEPLFRILHDKDTGAVLVPGCTEEQDVLYSTLGDFLETGKYWVDITPIHPLHVLDHAS